VSLGIVISDALGLGYGQAALLVAGLCCVTTASVEI